MAEGLRIKRDGHLLTLAIDRPSSRNALDAATSWAMHDALDALGADDDLWVAVLTATGDEFFCAGREGGGELPHTGFGGLVRRHDLDRPLIAAVNGHAHGPGFELVLACDLVVAAESATFGLPEVRAGLAPGTSALARLPRRVGPQRAAALALTGAQVGAGALRDWGLVHQVVPRGEVEGAAQALAGQLLEAAPLAVRAAKRVMRDGLGMSERDAIERGWRPLARLAETEDAVEAARARAERRPPRWRGS